MATVDNSTENESDFEENVMLLAFMESLWAFILNIPFSIVKSPSLWFFRVVTVYILFIGFGGSPGVHASDIYKSAMLVSSTFAWTYLETQRNKLE